MFFRNVCAVPKTLTSSSVIVTAGSSGCGSVGTIPNLGRQMDTTNKVLSVPTKVVGPKSTAVSKLRSSPQKTQFGSKRETNQMKMTRIRINLKKRQVSPLECTNLNAIHTNCNFIPLCSFFLVAVFKYLLFGLKCFDKINRRPMR
jgi:hypothetical protein